MDCSLYAGPLRWRQTPGGVGARTQTLHGWVDRGRAVLSSPRRALEPFHLSSVKLMPGGPFASAARTNAVFLRSLSQDRLFWSFRRTAGLPQPSPSVQPYGGWERPGAGIRGHFVGHYLGALASGTAGHEPPLSALALTLKPGHDHGRNHDHACDHNLSLIHI